MKNLHPIGIPHSILFESLFAKTYDAANWKKTRAGSQVFYEDHGYFNANVMEPTVTILRPAAKACASHYQPQ